jgi:chromosome partitioning protein
MRVLIHTQKGGVGKTTTALNLASALLRQGLTRHVLLSDLDPQQHLTAMVITGDAVTGPLDALPVRGEPGLFLARAGAEDVGTCFPAFPGNPDAWIILDTAPGWSPDIARAAQEADLVLCPLEPDFLGLSGVGRLLQRLEELGTGRERLRLLLTRYSPRLALHREVRDRLQAQFGTTLLPVEIRNSVRLAEAPGMGMTIFAHAPASTGCDDHRALATLLAGAQQQGTT